MLVNLNPIERVKDFAKVISESGKSVAAMSKVPRGRTSSCKKALFLVSCKRQEVF